MTEFFLTQKLGYRVIDTERLKIDGLAGFRYWHFGERASFTTNSLNFTGSQNWVDPVVGGRITGIWRHAQSGISVGGDVGGWGVGAQIDYQFSVLSAIALNQRWRSRPVTAISTLTIGTLLRLVPGQHD